MKPKKWNILKSHSLGERFNPDKAFPDLTCPHQLAGELQQGSRRDVEDIVCAWISMVILLGW